MMACPCVAVADEPVATSMAPPASATVSAVAVLSTMLRTIGPPVPGRDRRRRSIDVAPRGSGLARGLRGDDGHPEEPAGGARGRTSTPADAKDPCCAIAHLRPGKFPTGGTWR